jgi:hypothetical protein
MIECLPDDLRKALAKAHRMKARRNSRLLLHVGAHTYPILRRWEGGFAIDAAMVHSLRGQVVITDGARASWHCLIVASRLEGDALICDFKTVTPARLGPPRDYAEDRPAVAGLLPPA